ncbi:MAG: hypothetical protein WCU88_02815 [Elusimicrobiota bacterium]|jgi:hypothetical protein
MPQNSLRILFLSFILFVPGRAFALDEIASLSRQLARAAQEADVRRVAVIPFMTLEGITGPKGRLLAQMLAARLAETKSLEIVDAARVEAAMTSLSMKDSDLTDPAGLSRLSDALGTQALVTGSFASVGTQAALRARLYHAASKMVLADKDARVKADWLSRSEEILPYDATLNTPSAVRDVLAAQGASSASPEKLLALSPQEQLQLRDSITNTPCSESDRMIHKLEAGVIGIKASYWAGQVRKKKMLEKTAWVRSSSIIKDPLLKERYQSLFEQALKTPGQEPGSVDVQRFITYDRLAYELAERCRR